MRVLLVALAVAASAVRPQNAPAPKGARLADLTWVDAEDRLGASTVVVLPVAAAALEHGPHMKLDADLTVAEYLSRRVSDAADVVVAPALTYHHYPGFLDYPGSASVTLEAARAATADVVRSLARYGPRRFYVLVTHPFPGPALDPAAQALAEEGILLAYTNAAGRLARASATVRRQPGGSHADEVETSMLLHIDPGSVDMKKAARDFVSSTGELRLSRRAGAGSQHSTSGVWGDATLATAEKGRAIVDALVAGILEDIEVVRRAPLPAATRRGTPPAPAVTTAGPARSAGPPRPSGCTAGDERAMLAIGEAYTFAWTNADAEAISQLWSIGGDVVHPDGAIERTRQVIRQNRAETFRRREFRGSRYPLTIRNIRCLSADVAVVDGKWELRGVSDASGKPLPTFEGLCTLVLQRQTRPEPQGSSRTSDDRPAAAASSAWLIEAYRYTLNPTAVPLPTWSARPGIQIIK